MIEGLKVGHRTLQNTGLTVFLLDRHAPCGWWLCGSAPAMCEVNLLDPEATVDHIDALLFTGGSAFGLGAANGVMQWLNEQERGYPTRYGGVPIVPAAAIYDLSKEKSYPVAKDGYEACVHASTENHLQGAIGAGAGATVGKLLESARPMRGGIGYSLVESNGIKVLAYALVNSLGDIVDPQGKIIAGAVKEDGNFAHLEESLRRGLTSHLDIPLPNTTLIALFTNAAFDKSELTRLAKTAVSGMARAIRPVFTKYDGDALFFVSLGSKPADELLVSTLAIHATEQAIRHAVKDSVVL
ncbi:MAG: P1 family peptidase [Verrucomicrobia bacterium]|nr:P1 family peptidase [Verrucomicrobiota bacterium]